jgi:hypothetical protein
VVKRYNSPSSGCEVVDMVAGIVLGRLAAGLGNSLVEILDETSVVPRGFACLARESGSLTFSCVRFVGQRGSNTVKMFK